MATSILSKSTIKNNIPKYNEFWDKESSLITTTNLALYLDAANSSSYPGSGDTWFDISGNNRNVTLYNSPTFSTDNGGILNFNGTNQYGERAPTFISSGSNISVVLLTKWNTINSSQTGNTVFSDGRDGSGNGWSNMIGIWEPIPQLRPAVVTTSPTVQSVNAYLQWEPITNNKWYCVGYTFTQGSNIKGYLNGELYTTTTTTTTTFRSSTIGINLARFHGSTNVFTHCSIGALLVYSSALSDADMKKNFLAFKNRYKI
jgi:hypothetical protein